MTLTKFVENEFLKAKAAKEKAFKVKLKNEMLGGIFVDENVMRHRSVGFFTWWDTEGSDCPYDEYATSFDMPLTKARKMFGKDFSFIAWEKAILEVNNKFCKHKYNEIHRMEIEV